MITFPNDKFVKTRYPGYVWHLEEQVLYSFKSGVLKRLKRSPGFNRSWNPIPAGYQVSVNGVPRYLHEWRLKELKAPAQNETVDIEDKQDARAA
jgi:hypothetical protein